MKKQIISLLVLISLSFQFAYPQGVPSKPEAQNRKIRALYQKYGKAKVDEALAMIKKYGPWKIAMNYKKAKAAKSQAQKKSDVAYEAVYICKKKVCGRVSFDDRFKCLSRLDPNFCEQETLAYIDAKTKFFAEDRRVYTYRLLFVIGSTLAFMGFTAIATYFQEKDLQKRKVEWESIWESRREQERREDKLLEEIEESLQESRKLMPGIEGK